MSNLIVFTAANFFTRWRDLDALPAIMGIFLDWSQAGVVIPSCQHQEMLRDLSKRETRGVDKGRFKTYIDATPVEIRFAYSIWCSEIHYG